nr:D-alanyl-D-alanine carboxypeptidase [Roseospira goensis]
MMPGEALARYASIVVDAASGRILHARDVDNRLYPASMTKMMTLYLLFEAIDTGRLSMESRLHVSTRAAGQPPSKLGLRAGSTIAVKDAIRALVTKSANDVATVVAEALGSTEVNFARLMTQKARDLGMRRTSFRNASGLPNSGQKSTARDMAVLAMSLMQHFPHHYHFFSTTAFRYNGRTYGTHNNLMKRYPGADGLKTGYIRASGFNVAFSATRAGRRLVAVVFGGRSARSRDDHMAELMDKGFRLVTQASYSPYATGQRVRVVARPDLPSGVTPLPPALPPGKMGETRVAGLSTVIPRVISSLLDQPKPAASAHVTPVPPAAPGGAGAAGGTETVQGSARGATTTAALDTGPDQGGTWGVQVGAFSSLNAAERAAHDAARLLRDGPAPIRVRVIPHTVADGKLYRARLLGMGTESQARAACRDLRARERSCLVVVPTGWTVAAR